uniref:Pyrin domain-containing protein n=1 Tax=Dicentrarchus labrax TaxID=13489 RepID=A0A8C4HCX5_DICLA
MAKLKEDLLSTLKDLKGKEFGEFKWNLKEDDILEGFPGIPVAELENAERESAVDLMVQTHTGPGALKITLKNIPAFTSKRKRLVSGCNLSKPVNHNKVDSRRGFSKVKSTTMAKLSVMIWKALQQLKDDEFKKFKWFLKQEDVSEGDSGISVAQLENADRQDTVDLMAQKYGDTGAIKETMKVLEKISRNDLVPSLQNSCLDPKGKLGEGKTGSQTGKKNSKTKNQEKKHLEVKKLVWCVIFGSEPRRGLDGSQKRVCLHSFIHSSIHF